MLRLEVEQNRFDYENPAPDGSDRTLDKNSWKEQQASLVNVNALQLGRVLGGRYQLMEVLGEGGMSAVFLSRHKELDQLVAIKVLRFDRSAGNDALRRFLQEAKATFKLNHPNLIRLLDFSSAEEDLPYLVMEYVSGKTLSELLRERGRLEAKDVVDIFCQVCDGLAYAHARGIVHRDLKPSNIMLATEADGSRVAKIVDFGIAKMTHSDNEQHLTKTGEIFGSPFYMSPEQCRGLSPDHRSDLYSIGCAMFECLSGSVPYCGENSMRTLFMHIEEPIPTLKLPRYKSFATARALEEVVEQLLQKDPDSRFQSAAEVKKSLLACLERVDRPPAESATVVRKAMVNSPSILTPPNAVPGGSGLNKKVIMIASGIFALAIVIGGSAFGLYSARQGSSASLNLSGAKNSGSSEAGGQPASIESDPAFIALQKKAKELGEDLQKERKGERAQAERDRAAAEKALKDKAAMEKVLRDRIAKDKVEKQKIVAERRKATEQESVRQARSKLVDQIRSELAKIPDLKSDNKLDEAESICKKALQEAAGIEASNPIVRAAHFAYLGVLIARPEKARDYIGIDEEARKTLSLMSVKPPMNDVQQELVYGWFGQALNKSGKPDEAYKYFGMAANMAMHENTSQGDVRFAGFESGKLHAMAKIGQMARALSLCSEASAAQNKPPLAIFIFQTTLASLYLENKKPDQARVAIGRALQTMRRNHLEDHRHEYDRFADLCKKLKMPAR